MKVQDGVGEIVLVFVGKARRCSSLCSTICVIVRVAELLTVCAPVVMG